MYKQVFDPVGNSLLASAVFAALPLLTLFILLGALRVQARFAALAALVVALLVAIIVYGMPVGQAALSATEGAAFGFFPILWIGNTAPVAFGSIAVPIVTLGEITGIDKDTLGAMVGNQTPFLAVFVPFILVFVVDGRRGLRECWPVALVGGVTF